MDLSAQVSIETQAKKSENEHQQGFPQNGVVRLATLCSIDATVCALIYYYGCHMSQFTPFLEDIDPLLTASLHHLLISTLFRSVLLVYLKVHGESEFVKQYKSLYRLAVFLTASCMYIHQVARLLLDSETGLDLSYPLYIAINIWCAISTGIFSYFSYFIVLHIPPEEEKTDKKGKARKANKKDWVDTKDIPIKATLLKVASWYKEDFVWIVVAHGFLFFHATVESLNPYYKAKVIDVISSEEPAANLSRHAVWLAVVTVIGSLVSTGRSGLMTYIRARMHVRLRSRLFSAIIHRDMAFFDSTKSGEITATLTSDAESLGGVLDTVDGTITTAVRLVSMAGVMWTLSWQLTLVVVLGNAILVSATTVYASYIRKSGKKVQECRREASNIAQEVISSIRVVRSHGNEEAEVKRYSQKIQERAHLQLKAALINPTYSLLDQLLSLSLLISIVSYGGHLTVTGRITSGDLVSFILYMSSLGNSMSRMLSTYNYMMRVLGASDKVFQYLDQAKDVTGTTKYPSQQVEGRVQFKDVNFTYPARPDNQVLKNLSFEVNPGEVVALVGPSGAGKSTCFSLLQRFYQPDTGHVTLDQQPLSDFEHKQYHQKVALVAQEPTLFARSVRDNISYAMEDVGEDSVREAAIAANAHGFISDLKENYDTEVGERGMQLSGGQKQRVAIARSIIRDPRVLLLDEATSALDAESEQQVQDAIYRNITGRTVLVIAHRLSTVEKADRILVMENGSVAEQGSHTELLHKQGLYYRLVQRQLFKETTGFEDEESAAETKSLDSASSEEQAEEVTNGVNFE